MPVLTFFVLLALFVLVLERGPSLNEMRSLSLSNRLQAAHKSRDALVVHMNREKLPGKDADRQPEQIWMKVNYLFRLNLRQRLSHWRWGSIIKASVQSTWKYLDFITVRLFKSSTYKYRYWLVLFVVPCCLVLRISVSHPEGRGSITRMENIFKEFKKYFYII